MRFIYFIANFVVYCEERGFASNVFITLVLGVKDYIVLRKI